MPSKLSGSDINALTSNLKKSSCTGQIFIVFILNSPILDTDAGSTGFANWWKHF